MKPEDKPLRTKRTDDLQTTSDGKPSRVLPALNRPADAAGNQSRGLRLIAGLSWSQLGFLAVGLFYLGVLLAGWRQDLPYAPQINEPGYADRALRLAVTRHLGAVAPADPAVLNVYPLAVIYQGMAWLDRALHVFRSPVELALRFQITDAKFYWLGRLLSMFYGWLSLLLLWFLAREMFSPRIALLACGMYAGYWLPINQAQFIQPGSGMVFASLLVLWAVRRWQRQATWSRMMIVGLALGLAAAANYALASMALLLWPAARPDQTENRTVGRNQGQQTLAGWLLMAMTFLLLQPAWLRDFSGSAAACCQTVRELVAGWSFTHWRHNVQWYISQAWRWNLTGGQAQLVLLGWLMVWRWPTARLLRYWVLLWTALIALAVPQKQDWMVLLFPVLALWVALVMADLSDWLARSMKLTARWQWLPTAVLFLLLSVPVYHLTLKTLYQQMHPSTRITARDWAIAHLPPNSKIALEWFTAPMLGGERGFQVEEANQLCNQSLPEYLARGNNYFMTSSWIADSFLGNQQAYPRESGFYLALQQQGRVLQTVIPHAARPGSVITIYEISAGAGEEVRP